MSWYPYLGLFLTKMWSMHVAEWCVILVGRTMYDKYLANISVVINSRTSSTWNWIISIFRFPAIIDVWSSLISSNEFSRSDMKCLMLPLGCLYIPPMVRRWFRNFKAMNRLSYSHLLQLQDFFNSYSGLTMTSVDSHLPHFPSCYHLVWHDKTYAWVIDVRLGPCYERRFLLQ